MLMFDVLMIADIKVWQSLGFAIQFALGFGVNNIDIKVCFRRFICKNLALF